MLKRTTWGSLTGRGLLCFAGGVFCTSLVKLCVAVRIYWHSREDTPIAASGDCSAPLIFQEADDALLTLRKAETVLARRCASVLLVLERISDGQNLSAVLRTAEALGVQSVWIIASGNVRNKRGTASNEMERAAQAVFDAERFLTIRSFATTAECLIALKNDGRTVWATDLSQDAHVLAQNAPWVLHARRLPARLALVMGSEASGITPEMRSTADRLVHLPMSGFADSLNLSVAAALCLFAVLNLYPDVSNRANGWAEGEKAELRRLWYLQLARTPEQAVEYARMAHTPPAPFDGLSAETAHRLS
jgi:tRNA G18 (ribose-2'-O)-methylase SpoU